LGSNRKGCQWRWNGNFYFFFLADPSDQGARNRRPYNTGPFAFFRLVLQVISMFYDVTFLSIQCEGDKFALSVVPRFHLRFLRLRSPLRSRLLQSRDSGRRVQNGMFSLTCSLLAVCIFPMQCHHFTAFRVNRNPQRYTRLGLRFGDDVR